MKSVSSKLLIPVILLFIPSIMIYIKSENKGLEFIFDNILLIIGWLSMVSVYIIIRQREKTGKVSEQQLKEINDFVSSNDYKKRNRIFIILIIIAGIIWVWSAWYYSIPLFIIALIIYLPLLKKAIIINRTYNKTDENEKND